MLMVRAAPWGSGSSTDKSQEEDRPPPGSLQVECQLQGAGETSTPPTNANYSQVSPVQWPLLPPNIDIAFVSVQPSAARRQAGGHLGSHHWSSFSTCAVLSVVIGGQLLVTINWPSRQPWEFSRQVPRAKEDRNLQRLTEHS